MTTPVWLLDVDGVINANRCGTGWGAAPFTKIVYDGSIDWKMRWAPALIDRIRKIHADGLAEIRWCTTWAPWVELLTDAFRLPAFPAADGLSGITGGQGAWRDAKYKAAFAVVQSGRPLIWTDDDAIPQVRGGLLREALAGSLLIEPQSNRGLLPEHLDEIEAFCRRHASVTA